MAVQHTRIPFSDLVFLEDNPRTRTQEGLQQMAADIEADPTFFENRPVLVNLFEGRNQVYAGDLRAHAAHDVLGWADIPCIVERDVPPEVMRRRAIIDNLHRETWAADILASSWSDEDLAGWGLTPDKWGGDADDTDMPAGNYTASDDDYEPPAEIVTDIVAGDLFEIGPHRLLCGDSTSADDVGRLMKGEDADMIFTDPPYGLGGYGGRKKMALQGDDGDVSDFYMLLIDAPEKYIWGNFKNLMHHIKDEPKDVIVWRKNNFGLGKGYRGQYELCFYYGDFSGSDSDVWDVSKEPVYSHPTQKPVELPARAMRNSTEKLALVADLFLGSGTTMVAAHQLNRRCYGMEIDPKYCQVILDRMLKLDPTLTITRNGKKYKPKKTAESPEF